MASGLGAGVSKAGPAFTVDEAVARARKQNPEILMAAKQLEAAKGGVIEARSGFLPGVVSTHRDNAFSSHLPCRKDSEQPDGPIAHDDRSRTRFYVCSVSSKPAGTQNVGCRE
jgi:hypothetical protein